MAIADIAVDFQLHFQPKNPQSFCSACLDVSMPRGRLTVATLQCLRMLESPDQSMCCLGCSGEKRVRYRVGGWPESGPGRKTDRVSWGISPENQASYGWYKMVKPAIYGWFFIALYINIISCKGLWGGLWRVCQALTVKIPKIEHRHSSGWVCKQSRYAQLRFLERRIHGDLTYCTTFK